MTIEPTTEAIWSHLSSDLRRFIRRRVSDDHVADDLLQETFMRVHRNIASLKDADRLAAWVYQIARNVVHDHHRKAAHATVPLTSVNDVSDDERSDGHESKESLASHESHEANESHESQAGCANIAWLNEMIQALPDGYRQAVQLAEIEQQTQQNVAGELGLSLSGAKARIQRGRVMLKEILERCCSFEVDVRGQVMGCDPKPNQQVCRECGE